MEKYDVSCGDPRFDKDLCRKSAESGYAVAQYNMGIYYWATAYIDKQGREEAFKWFSKAAGQEYFRADYMLGEYFSCPDINNATEAIKCYEIAASHGNADACLALAERYKNGRGVHRDTDKAAYWRDKAKMASDSQ